MSPLVRLRKPLTVVLALALLMLPAGIAFGHFAPWPAADALLRRDHPGSTALLVGAGYESHSVGDVAHEERSATYVLVPASLRSGSTFTVREVDGKADLREERHGLLVALGGYLAIAITIWWLWRRPPPRAEPR